MLWIKAFHIIFVTSWFAGLFYLPRLFVNHAMISDSATSDRLKLMELKLFRFMLPLALLAIAFGLWLWLGYGASGHWMHAKLTLVSILVAYHFYCGKLLTANSTSPKPTGQILTKKICSPLFKALTKERGNMVSDKFKKTPLRILNKLISHVHFLEPRENTKQRVISSLIMIPLALYAIFHSENFFIFFSIAIAMMMMIG